MDFLKLVESARSCRRFMESDPLTEQDLRWLVRCARAAPSGKNAQELRFITVTKGQILYELFSHTRWGAALKDWNGPSPSERPTGFIALLMPKNNGPILHFDVGIAAQTIQLAAASRAWGACIIMSFNQAEASRLLNAPPEMSIALLIGLGVPAETRVLEDMPPNGSTAYWRDSGQIHHVPKRSLDELIIGHF